MVFLRKRSLSGSSAGEAYLPSRLRLEPMNVRALVPPIALALLLAACSLVDADPTSTTQPITSLPALTTTTQMPPPTTQPAELPQAPSGLCASFAEEPAVMGTITNPDVTEASGIATSRRHPGTIWIHNDSGSDPVVHAVAEDGTSLGSFAVDALAFDWEDMALGPGPDPNRDYLYLGDIGDNLHFRPVITVHRIPEPDPAVDAGPITSVESFNLRYPEPGPDSEAMLVDPVTGDILVITKEDSGSRSLIYRAPAGELSTGSTTELRLIGSFDLEPGTFVTAADIDRTGAVVVFRGYNEVWMWERTDIGFEQTFSGEPCRTPSTAEVQGEAIAFAADGFGYFTVSEGSNPDINFVASNIES